jgi:hypothetical protein
VAQRADLWGANPGERRYVKIPVFTDLGGHEVYLPVHVVRGARPGPTLTLISTLHGNEWISIDILRRVLDRVVPADLSGAIVAVTVGNPVALTTMRRNTPDDSDSPDLNRSFGMPWNFPAEQLARAMTDEVFSRTDILLDFHTLCWGSAFGVVIYGNDFPDAALNARTDELARIYGYPMLHAGPRNPRTATGTAGGLGIPSLTVEIGGTGFSAEQEDAWLEENVAGIYNVMYHEKMLPGAVRRPKEFHYWGKRWRLSPKHGGYLHSFVGPERLLGEVKAGELLGVLRSPLSLEVLEELRAPGDGRLYCVARSYCLRPGEWAFGVVQVDTRPA